MENISVSSTITRNKEIITADMDGETVMMNIVTGKYYNLGNLGSVIWTMIENPIKVETVINNLLEKYNVEQQKCEDEVLAFLNKTYKEGLITI